MEPKNQTSLEELYKLWNDSQSYVAERVEKLGEDITALQTDVTKMNDNLAKLLQVIKEKLNGK